MAKRKLANTTLVKTWRLGRSLMASYKKYDEDNAPLSSHRGHTRTIGWCLGKKVNKETMGDKNFATS